MADDIVIRAEGLGKKYVIGHEAEHERYVALRDIVMRTGRNAWRKTSDLLRGRDIVAGDEVEEFWALKDVSFEVRRGEVLGIIGRNGAGKSTLLKVLSRITDPSEGRVTIKGRVASLLEVGTGFHPELTGRENIYLNGAVLGMKRAEIKRKFDEIVAFAEVEKFLDTPVKRYSSGMYVRLAFAVAAHLEPEILVVDEVLAVGDAEFQKKCLGKMQDVAGHGRTVLFVSHNMAAILQLCPRSILLANGRLAHVGPTGNVIDEYINQRQSRKGGTGAIALGGDLTLEQTILETESIRTSEPAVIRFEFSAVSPGQIHECALNIYTAKGVKVAIVDAREFGQAPFKYGSGRFRMEAQIAALPFVEGDYTLGLWLVSNEFTGFLPELVEFVVHPSNVVNGFVPYPADVRGLVALNSKTSVELAAMERI